VNQPRLLQRLGKPPRRIVGRRMLRVEVNSDLHVEDGVRSYIPTFSPRLAVTRRAEMSEGKT